MKPITKIAVVDTARPDPETIRRAALLIRQGGVVVFPTLGLYGLGADPLNPEAVARIFTLKGRDPSKPLLVLIDHPDMMHRIALPVNPMARRLMERFWPGRITFVVQARPDLPPALTAGTGKIGVRQAAHPVAAALVRAVGNPLVGTSANLTGAGGCATVGELDPAVVESVDWVLDAGSLSGAPSTVVDVTDDTPVILREGAVLASVILE
ncbi:MAG: threonylcarbamoyl-AMP synthase [Desulfatitalea sp.]|nr:threonylcarbamoyl-AMP synthase [Desulfatitalea sp.]